MQKTRKRKMVGAREGYSASNPDAALYLFVPATVLLFAFFLPAHYVSTEAGIITIIIFAAMMSVLFFSCRPARAVHFQLECAVPGSDSSTFTITADQSSSMLQELASITGWCAAPAYCV